MVALIGRQSRWVILIRLRPGAARGAQQQGHRQQSYSDPRHDRNPFLVRSGGKGRGGKGQGSGDKRSKLGAEGAGELVAEAGAAIWAGPKATGPEPGTGMMLAAPGPVGRLVAPPRPAGAVAGGTAGGVGAASPARDVAPDAPAGPDGVRSSGIAADPPVVDDSSDGGGPVYVPGIIE
jgi:hypothetical protein